MIPADMDESGPPGMAPVVRGLVIVTLCAFAAQHLLDFRTAGGITGLFGLSRDGLLQRGYAWQLFTYMFLHGGFLHILFNMIVLHSFGRELEARIGPSRFLALYLLSGVVGGIGWLVFSADAYRLCIGASGAVFGVMAAFAARDPERRLTLVLFPVPVPITLRARTLLLVFAGVSLVLMLLDFGHVAHAAHLAGGLVGFWYGRRLRAARGRAGEAFWTHGRPPPPPPGWGDETADVNRILEKIREKGLNSLTQRERDVLERASRRGSGSA